MGAPSPCCTSGCVSATRCIASLLLLFLDAFGTASGCLYAFDRPWYCEQQIATCQSMSTCIPAGSTCHRRWLLYACCMLAFGALAAVAVAGSLSGSFANSHCRPL